MRVKLGVCFLLETTLEVATGGTFRGFCLAAAPPGFPPAAAVPGPSLRPRRHVGSSGCFTLAPVDCSWLGLLGRTTSFGVVIVPPLAPVASSATWLSSGRSFPVLAPDRRTRLEAAWQFPVSPHLPRSAYWQVQLRAWPHRVCATWSRHELGAGRACRGSRRRAAAGLAAAAGLGAAACVRGGRSCLLRPASAELPANPEINNQVMKRKMPLVRL